MSIKNAFLRVAMVYLLEMLREIVAIGLDDRRDDHRSAGGDNEDDDGDEDSR